MLEKIKNVTKQKAQGIVEYALLLAFVVGIAMMLNGANLGGAIKGTFEGVADYLGGYVTASKNYGAYFKDWRSLQSDELREIPSADRLKADQEGLALIASFFLGKTKDEVVKLMTDSNDGFTNRYDAGGDWLDDNVNADRMGPGEDGWSQIMVPLSYWNTDMDGEFNASGGKGYSWLECSKNVNLINAMADGAVEKVNAGKNNEVINYNGRTATKDRLFYSDNMIGSDSKDRAIAMKVHYNGDKVDQVWIAAQTGTEQLVRNNKNVYIEGNASTGYGMSPGNSALHGNSTSIQGLDLTVTGSSSSYKFKSNN